MFATAVWLASACVPVEVDGRRTRLERCSADGQRRAAVVEVGGDAGIGSLVLLAEAGATAFEPGQMLAAFDRRVEAVEWSGADLLLGFDSGCDVRAFSIFPGLRIVPAPPPASAGAALSWLRLSTRRSRR
jgi:hypothetical protein